MQHFFFLTFLIWLSQHQKRFTSVTDADVDAVTSDQTPKSTNDATRNWVRIFEEFLKRSNVVLDLMSCTKEELCLALSCCYVGMRTQAGGTYQYNSYKAFRAAISRHVQKLGRNLDIFNDVEFRRSNEAFEGIIKKLRRKGEMNPIAHKDIITNGDYNKIKYLLDHKKDTRCLTEQVWFYVTLHFGIRGCELQCLLRKTDLQFHTDEHGAKYVKLGTDFAQKNHQLEGIATPSGRIQNLDQVHSIEMLISKLNPECDRLLQRPRINYSAKDKCWFTKAPMGKNALGDIMKGISDDAKTSKKCTNHCLQAFTVSRLNAQNVPERHIMTVTGHGNAQSLTSYCRPTDDQERQMAAVLDTTMTCTTSSATTPSPASSATVPVSPNKELGMEIVDLLQGIPDEVFDTESFLPPPPVTQALLPIPSIFDTIDSILSNAMQSELIGLETPPVSSAPSSTRAGNHIVNVGAGNNFAGALFHFHGSK